MLSVLIPVFHFDVRPLVKTLVEQCEAAGIVYEVRCLDDASSAPFQEMNRDLGAEEKVNYQELSENVGRAKIRNILAQQAQYDYLLFMDCDSQVNQSNYIQQYLDQLVPGTLLYGGRSYAETAPADPTLYFHWYYGTQREQQSASQRQKAPYHSFMTNNFLIPKAIFLDIQLDERLKQYGHEDTLFGLALAQKKVPLIHLDNPLEHIGLEKWDVFLRKSQQALENLRYLSRQRSDLDTRLLRFYRKIKAMKLGFLFLGIERLTARLIIKNLQSQRPSLWVFDLYKLLGLLKLDQID
ncbi:MAG: glycosyltransferase family 2 protein [Bacteroidota bacterium]